MSSVLEAAEEARCSVCVLKSALQEQMRQKEALQFQAHLAAKVATAHGESAKGEEAKRVAAAIAAEILFLYGQGGI